MATALSAALMPNAAAGLGPGPFGGLPVGMVLGNQEAQPRVNGRQANAGVIGPLATVTFTTTAIQPQRSGLFMVWGNLSANASGVSNQTGTMLADATVIDNAIAGTGGAGPFDLNFLGFIQLAKNATHTFSVSSVASAGTNTIPAGDAAIMFMEL